MIVGYAFANYISGLSVGAPPLSQVSHIVLERLRTTSTTNMTLVMDSGMTAAALNAAVAKCHAAGVKAHIELYSAWDSTGYNAIFTNISLRQSLVANLASFVSAYNLDGVDSDWESDVQSNLDKAAFSQFFAELKQALGNSKGISMAAPYNKITILPTAAQHFDAIDVMCYDVGTPWYGSYSVATNAMNFWANAGIPKNKLCMGISFAARDPWTAYKTIVQQYNPLPSANSAGGLTFNGIDLVKQKTQFVRDNGFGGCMCYSLGLDIYDSRSLLKAIYDTLSMTVPPPPPPPPPPVEAGIGPGVGIAALLASILLSKRR